MVAWSEARPWKLLGLALAPRIVGVVGREPASLAPAGSPDVSGRAIVSLAPRVGPQRRIPQVISLGSLQQSKLVPSCRPACARARALLPQVLRLHLPGTRSARPQVPAAAAARGPL